MRINNCKYLAIAALGCLVLLRLSIASAQTNNGQEIKRIYKQLIDAENKHDLPAVRALVWNSLRRRFSLQRHLLGGAATGA